LTVTRDPTHRSRRKPFGCPIDHRSQATAGPRRRSCGLLNNARGGRWGSLRRFSHEA
jgi:hypothetical protein